MALVAGPGSIVCQINAACCDLLDGTAVELMGRPFCSFLAEPDRWQEGLDRVFHTAKPESQTVEQPFERPAVLWTFTMWPVVVQDQPVGVMIQVSVSTKHQKQTVAMNEALVIGSMHQHELTEASQKLNAQLREEIAERITMQRALAEKVRLLDLSNDAIAVLDLERRIRYWNRGAEALYGWTREEAVGKISHLLLHTEFSEPFEKISEALERNNHWTGELSHVTRDGRRISVLVRKVVDRDDQGKAVAILESMTDVTERAKADEALREARTRLADRAGELEELVAERTAELTATNQQLEAFVYSMAHDLRAPLRSMQGFSALVLGDSDSVLSAPSRDFLQRIDQSAQFMDAMLSDLLAFSRISQQQVELKRVNLEAVTGSVLARVQKEIQDVNACVECSGPWPDVLAHEGTLIQILLNLTGNALKFVRPGVLPNLRLRAEERSGVVRVWVEDNGVGIAPDYLEQIFRLFIRLDRGKYPGTGAGLAIVRKGVERMGGRVGVESTLGHGSRFWIELLKYDPATFAPQ